MKYGIASLLLIASLCFSVLAQTATRPPAGPISLVVVNGQTFTSADLEPTLREELERLDDKIAEARTNVLDLQINTMLLEAEAKRRGINTHRLYELEVTNRLAPITPAQIKKFMDDNRQQFEGADPATTNQQVTDYLREEAEHKLADDLVKRLRKTIPVVIGVDVNSPNLSRNAVVATVAGQPLKADSLLERLKPIVYKMKLETYELTKESWTNSSTICCCWKKPNVARLDQRKLSEPKSAIKLKDRVKLKSQSFTKRTRRASPAISIPCVIRSRATCKINFGSAWRKNCPPDYVRELKSAG